MTNSPDEMAWSPMQFATQLQEASQEMTTQQMQAFTELLSGRRDSSQSTLDPAGLTSLGTEMAMFKTRVQSGGRISIPDTEREVLGIDEGDIVQTFVIPVPQSSSGSDQ
ncbi:AbrB/MazE/SpoVT family DNA-binding domain-containing protein [Halohasta salina]|uniref:AbrB/MazE/SpoVT family DNA-binding domain-containing protein n=1 Tax=Halohasta salina TaxID=2961621 RepID=UPI0020A5774F|nr:AbrB/MazE/SpoVT family DNA-binding domain-containing protein [Halohasta salina]